MYVLSEYRKLNTDTIIYYSFNLVISYNRKFAFWKFCADSFSGIFLHGATNVNVLREMGVKKNSS